MPFEMIITKRKPTAEGVEEHIVRIKNGESVSTGNELLDILRLALDSPAPFALRDPSPVMPSEWSEPTIALLKTENTPPPAPPKKEKSIPTTPSRPKQVDLIGSKSTGFSIGEMLTQFQEKKEEKAKDEVVKKDGKPPRVLPYNMEPIDRNPERRVKLWVNCPACGFEGDKGIHLGNTYHHCPNNECRTKLFVIDATDEHGAKDDKGYVRLAQDRFLTKEELYNKYHSAQEN